MLLPNNSLLDINTVNKAVEAVAAQRRRSAPLLKAPENQTMQQLTAKPHAPALLKLRSMVARLPVVGLMLQALYRRMYPIFAPATHWKQRIRMVPVVGAVGAWIFAVTRLEQSGKLVVQLNMRLQRLEALNMAQRLEQIESVNMAQRLEQIESVNTAQRLAQYDTIDIAARLNRIESVNTAQRLAQYDTIDIAARLNRLDEYQVSASKFSQMLDNRMAAVTRELRRATASSPEVAQPQEAPPMPVRAPGPSNHNMDGFYIDLEDTFRGTRQDITQRLEVYLPHFDQFRGDPFAHVVDVGCGRGEWLELMNRCGIKATGIDLNAAMVDTCQQLGLQALCMDAVQYLRQQPEGSLVAVTGFHIIEHLPLDTLLALFDAALKALRPDGLIIFETPNPENILVGACNFYHDPTHLNPIVPVVAEFMAGQRGFSHTRILRLHPYPQDHLIPDDGLLAKRFNALFYGPQDYALLAWKTHD